MLALVCAIFSMEDFEIIFGVPSPLVGGMHEIASSQCINCNKLIVDVDY